MPETTRGQRSASYLAVPFDCELHREPVKIEKGDSVESEQFPHTGEARSWAYAGLDCVLGTAQGNKHVALGLGVSSLSVR